MSTANRLTLRSVSRSAAGLPALISLLADFDPTDFDCGSAWQSGDRQEKFNAVRTKIVLTLRLLPFVPCRLSL